MKDLLRRNIIKHKRPIKYLIAGGTSTFVDLLFIYFFTDILGIWYLFSACLAFAVAFFVSFFLQKFWTFRDNDKELMYKQMRLYLTVALANLVLNAVLMFIFVDGFKVWYMLAQVMASGLVACESYFVYKVLIFNRDGLPKNEGIKILIATGIYPPDIGGPATYAEELSRELRKLNCEIKIITYNESQSYKQEDTVYINRTKNIILRYLNFFWQTNKLASWADIIYTLDLMSAGLPAVLAAKLNGKKVIFRTGGDFLWEKAFQSGWTNMTLAEYYKGKKNLLEKFLIFFCSQLIKMIDLVIFSTEFQARIYKDYYGLPEAKIKLIANASPEIKDAPSDCQPGDFFVFAGRLIKLKNLSRLIRAFASTRKNNFKLIIFGQGPERENLMALIKEFRLEKKVEIRGRIEQKRLISFINDCRSFILPSITEISPNLALECLSLRKPIILTQETGLAERLVSGLIKIDPLSEEDIKNKFEYLMNDNNLAEYKANLARLAIEPRGWSRIAEEHFNIFKNLKWKKSY